MTNKNFAEHLLLFSAISIPVFTILLATNQSPFNYTLSMIGNWFSQGERIKFIIWGIATAIALTFFIINLYKRTHFKNKNAYYFLYSSAIFLILTVLIPTLNREPIPKELRSFLSFNYHELFAVLFAIFLMLSLYTFTKYLSKIDEEISVKATKHLLITAGGSIFLLTIFGMTGIFEIFFFIALAIFLIILNSRITLHKKQN